jgi:hypothetical protein
VFAPINKKKRSTQAIPLVLTLTSVGTRQHGKEIDTSDSAMPNHTLDERVRSSTTRGIDDKCSRSSTVKLQIGEHGSTGREKKKLHKVWKCLVVGTNNDDYISSITTQVWHNYIIQCNSKLRTIVWQFIWMKKGKIALNEVAGEASELTGIA